jgi:hypothetical protein
MLKFKRLMSAVSCDGGDSMFMVEVRNSIGLEAQFEIDHNLYEALLVFMTQEGEGATPEPEPDVEPREVIPQDTGDYEDDEGLDSI